MSACSYCGGTSKADGQGRCVGCGASRPTASNAFDLVGYINSRQADSYGELQRALVRAEIHNLTQFGYWTNSTGPR